MKSKKDEEKKCSCRWCVCKDTGDELIEYGGKWYHEKCYKNSRNLIVINDIWCKTIDDKADYSSIARIVKDLVRKDNIDSDFLVFAVKYGAANKILKHPPGLRYLVKDYKIQKAFDKKKIKDKARKIKRLQESKNENREELQEEVKFEYTPKKANFLDIFGGTKKTGH